MLIYDKVIGAKSPDTLPYLVAGIVILVLADLVLRFSGPSCSESWQAGLDYLIGVETFRQMIFSAADFHRAFNRRGTVVASETVRLGQGFSPDRMPPSRWNCHSSSFYRRHCTARREYRPRAAGYGARFFILGWYGCRRWMKDTARRQGAYRQAADPDADAGGPQRDKTIGGESVWWGTFSGDFRRSGGGQLQHFRLIRKHEQRGSGHGNLSDWRCWRSAPSP